MARERESEKKPLSFSTTMRNPARIVAFLKCLLPYEGQILTNELIDKLIVDTIKNKLYKPIFINRNKYFNDIYESEEVMSLKDIEEVIKNSPQQHKEAGFDEGWPSRFDTFYKLPMEFGFLFYSLGAPIEISKTGHMLVDAFNEEPANNVKIQNVFLNALTKYHTNNPFKKNALSSVPLVLLLKTIDLLKKDTRINAQNGLFVKELSMLICWPNNNANELCDKIVEVRQNYGFTYSDDTMYDICLGLLGATRKQTNRFKLNQITGEAVDEFIRKMRITGVVSLRGNGRFLDHNAFEIERITYIINNYDQTRTFEDKRAYYSYQSEVDTNLLQLKNITIETDDIKIQAINKWANHFERPLVESELKALIKKTSSKDELLRIIDRPTRLEFLTSIILKQQFKNLIVKPNYNIDDEGLPTFTAAGGMADIECFDKNCNPLFEVTLMTSRNQAINEMPAITRHLKESADKYADKQVFSVLVAPSIHEDTRYMAEFSKFRDNVDIRTLTINEFIDSIKEMKNITELC